MTTSLLNPNRVKVAATSFTPAFLDKTVSTEKVCNLIRKAASSGAAIIAFPETAIPGYPGWGQTIPAEGPKAMELCIRLFQNSIEIPGPETEKMSLACSEGKIYAVVGVNERRRGTTGTMYNTQLFFGPDGAILHKHQKFVPTVTERLVHAPGTTGSSSTIKTEFGGLSALICGENMNPLAIYSISLDYPVIHVASWPPHFAPDVDSLSTILTVSQAEAKMLGCFILNSVTIDDDEAVETYSAGQAPSVREGLERQRGTMGATIIAPSGRIIAGPLPPGEDILYTEIDIEEVIAAKMDIDVAGHYNRPDLFAHHFKPYI